MSMGKSSGRPVNGRHDYPYFRAVWNRIVITMLAAAFLPVLLIGGGLYFFTLKVMEEKGLESLKLETLERKISVDRSLEEIILDLRRLVLDPGVEPLLSPGAMDAALHSLNRAHGYFSGLAVFSPDGRCLAFAGTEAGREVDVSQEEWFKEALGKGVSITDVFRGSRGAPCFLAAVKVHAGDGVMILGASVDAARFSDMLSGEPGPRIGDAYLINREGVFQTPPRTAGQLLSRSPVKNTEKFDRIEVEESARSYLLKVWQDRVPWMNVVQIDHSDTSGQLMRVYAFAFLVFLVLAIPIAGIVLIIGNSLASRLETKRSSLKMLDRQLRRASYLSSSMELSLGCFREIKDVLANIDITAVVALEDPAVTGSADARESIDEVLSQTRRGQQSVERFLRYIEPEPPLIRDVDVQKLLDDLLDILARELRFRNITVRREFQVDLPAVRSDRSKLRQVFQNIIINALEAVEKEGEIRLTTGLRENGIVVTISDNGPGIPAGDLKEVFKPLWTTRPQGTGLGLPLCREILDKLDGHIEIESTVGRGTSVIIVIPLRLDPQRLRRD